MDNYAGYSKINLSQEEMADFYSNNKLPMMNKPYQNEYFIILDENDKVVDKVCYQNGKFRPLAIKEINNDTMGTIKSRNIEQDFAFDMLRDETTPIKILTGRFGSGKTMLMIAHALSLIQKGKVEKIVYVRNNIELKDTTPLGALPGSLNDKLFAWAANIADHVGGVEGLNQLIQRNKFEISPLGYLRGRDFKNTIIFCDESENLTISQVQLLIGRIGEGSQLWLAGDYKQVDKQIFKTNSGLRRAVDRLKGQELFAYVNLEKSERSKASSYADLLD